MTATINSQCSSFTVDSTNLVSTNQSVQLIVTHNDCTTKTTLSISPAYTEITILPTDLGLTAFADGVYGFELCIVTQTAVVIKETACVFVDCSTTCAMLPIYSDLTCDANKLAALSYYALRVSNNCTNCACSDLCALFSNITNASSDTSCGCN